MTNTRKTTNEHEINAADNRRRRIRLAQLIFAAAATAATLALFSTAQPNNAPIAAPGSAQLADAPSTGDGSVIAVDDDDIFNPSSGDVFTQNAQDQSTA
jgi:hypothetical protein